MPVSLALALALAVQPASPAPDHELLLEIGDLAPPFAMRDLDRKVFSLSDHVGPEAKDPRAAVVVAFFATWCGPCKQEIPLVKALWREWHGHGVGFVYVGLSQGPGDLAPFAKEAALPWPVVPDTYGLLGRRYGASQLPHLFVIDSAGRIAFQHRGVAPDLEAVVGAQLARLTGREAPLVASAPQDVVRERFTRKLRLGRVPASEGSAARWQPLAAYVGELANADVEVSTEASYDAFEAALRQGKYDIANAGPLVCDEVASLYEPVARLERQGVPTYQGILFVPRSSDVKTVADLRGKRVALVSDRSTSGGLYVKLALIAAGLDPDRDVHIVWAGSHEKVAAVVRNGGADAGGCYEDCRDSAWPVERDKAVATRILAYTAPIPGDMIVVRRGLDEETKRGIRQALLSLNESAGILAQISQGELTVTGFAPASESDLRAIEDAVARVAAKRSAGGAAR